MRENSEDGACTRVQLSSDTGLVDGVVRCAGDLGQLAIGLARVDFDNFLQNSGECRFFCPAVSFAFLASSGSTCKANSARCIRVRFRRPN